ncbi:unnamed protein product [Mytilus edulis]|uniref:Uncharacterized protein n=1 Tax=Mytilus edulis TaxID=6550 RepID=A0A8S3VGU4_MYTED|nr:unnamed protein product [Mytilus edulis]
MKMRHAVILVLVCCVINVSYSRKLPNLSGEDKRPHIHDQQSQKAPESHRQSVEAKKPPPNNEDILELPSQSVEAKRPPPNDEDNQELPSHSEEEKTPPTNDEQSPNEHGPTNRIGEKTRPARKNRKNLDHSISQMVKRLLQKKIKQRGKVVVKVDSQTTVNVLIQTGNSECSNRFEK